MVHSVGGLSAEVEGWFIRSVVYRKLSADRIYN